MILFILGELDIVGTEFESNDDWIEQFSGNYVKSPVTRESMAESSIFCL